MRLFARVLALLCVIHVLALLAFAGWMVGTGRVTAERWQELTALFEEMIAKTGEQAAAEAEQAAQVGQDAAQLAERVDAQVPASASEQLADQQVQQAVQRQQLDRARQEVENLQRTLRLAQSRFQQKLAEFDAQRTAFEQRLAEIEQRQNDEGFRRTLRLIEALPPDQAKQMFLSMIQRNQIDEVVGYLQAMQPRLAGKVLKTFETPREIDFVVDLTERLRRAGSNLIADTENVG